MAGELSVDSLTWEDRKAAERLDRLATKTAAKVGDEFFVEVVRTLAEILEVSHMTISECLQDSSGRVRSLAYFARNKLRDNVEYDLAGTPCENVYGEGVYFCNKDVQKAFPADKDLAGLQAESYGGVSLLDSQGTVIGFLCYLNDTEIEDSTWQIPPLKLIRARCGAEIERMRLERTRIQQQEVVEESKRLASLGTLAAGIAHEINNPLTTIQLMLDYGLQASEKDKVMPRRNLELMMDSVKSISQIVEGVLRAASDKDTVKTSCDLTSIIRRACDLTSYTSETPQIKVTFEVAKSCDVTGNPLELQQVFVNLISNAIQATTSAGQNEDVEITITEESGNFVITIRNHGTKIPEDELRRIFEPFYTSRHTQGGTGLGLSVSLGIIKAHGGDISVQSNSESTKFLVRIPIGQGGRLEHCHS